LEKYFSKNTKTVHLLQRELLLATKSFSPAFRLNLLSQLNDVMKDHKISHSEETQIYMSLLNITKIKTTLFYTLKADTLKISPVGVEILKVLNEQNYLTLLSKPNILLDECFARVEGFRPFTML
jgi:hypothetical protein